MNTYLRIKQMRNYQKFFTKMLKKQENINNEKAFKKRNSAPKPEVKLNSFTNHI